MENLLSATAGQMRTWGLFGTNGQYQDQKSHEASLNHLLKLLRKQSMIDKYFKVLSYDLETTRMHTIEKLRKM